MKDSSPEDEAGSSGQQQWPETTVTGCKLCLKLSGTCPAALSANGKLGSLPVGPSLRRNEA